MKRFTSVGAVQQEFGILFKRQAVIKRFQTDDGLNHEFTTWGRVGDRAGAVIAITPDKKVVITYQFRAGPERWMYDLPGGGFEDGEEEKAAALRELKEETGYESKQVTSLGTTCRDAYCNITWSYFLATDCYLSQDGDNKDKEETDQGAEMRLISIDELIDNAKHDRMTDPAAVLMAYDELIKLNKEA